MQEAQGGLCAICGSPCVVHSYRSGTVRGLICRSCNLALRLLKDCPRVLGTALEYLKHHAACFDGEGVQRA